MNKQFFYTRSEPIAPKEGETEIKIKAYIDSINLAKVTRSIEMENGDLLVLLDDIHQRVVDTPIYNKHNRVTGYKKQTNTYQTEIMLKGEDIIRFREAFNQL